MLKAIENEFDILKKTGAYAVTLRIEGNYYHLPEQKELILFRMFQEIINNIIKHAQASAIDISIIFQPKQFMLCINDNGIGFNIADIDTSKGIGLKNIINRSQLIGAFYSIDSKAAKGTTIKITLPVSKHETAL